MKIRTSLTLSFATAILTLASACSTTTSSTHLPKGDLIGTEMTPQPSVRFSVVDATPKQYLDKTVLVEATVKAVCQHRGCWMQVEDEGHTAVVRWASGCGGKYEFPKDSIGRRVLIQGNYFPAYIDPSEAEHMEEEAGHKLDVAGERNEIKATSVILLER